MPVRCSSSASHCNTAARAEARELLGTALDEASGMGATGIADRAHRELIAAAWLRRDHRALSGRELLTASEDRVAVLTAAS